MSSTLFNKLFGNATSTPNITLPSLTTYTPGGTAPPPQMPRVDWNTLTLMRENAVNVYGLAELTGLPSLYRWGKAIWTGRPYPEIEKEYFTPLYKQLQGMGAVPPDYLLQNLSDDDKKKLQALGVPTSPEDVAGQVAGRSLVFSLAAVPGLAGASRQLLKQLAVEAAVGFGVPGTMAAATRVVQGYPNEALPAFIDVGLSSTVLADVLTTLKGLPNLIRNAPNNIVRSNIDAVRNRLPPALRDSPEVNKFTQEIQEAVLKLKQGDTAKWDDLLRQFEDWQKKLKEFEELDKLKRWEALPADKEKYYYELKNEVDKIRDKFEVLKEFVDTVKGSGLEDRGRWLADYKRFTSWRQTISDLATAAGEMPPGPVRDVFKTLQEMDYDRLWRIVNNPQARANLAKRLGIDEQTLAEQATAFLKQKQLEKKLAELSNDELNRILTDRDLLKKYADEFGISESDLMTRAEEILQQRKLGVEPTKTEQPKPPESEPQPSPPQPPPIELPKSDVRPPIRRTPRRETQFRPPETEVTTKDGQVLVVKPKEEPKPTADAKTRLKRVPRRRPRVEEESDVDVGGRMRDSAESGERETAGRTEGSAGDRTTDVQADRGTQTDKNVTNQTDNQTTDNTTQNTNDQTSTTTSTTTTSTTTTTAASDRVVINRETLRMIIPTLPASVFAMPAMTVLAMISQAAGAPIALPPNVPRPLPRESFGNWLNRVFAGSGFTWRSLAAQKEAFVFA